MALLYTCYADQPVIDALVAPFSAPDPGYFTWVFGTATQNGNVPNFVLAQKGPSAIPAAWETAAKKLILTDTRTKIRKGARYGLSGRKPRLLDGNWRLDKICVLPTRCPAASSRCAQIQAGSAQ